MIILNILMNKFLHTFANKRSSYSKIILSTKIAKGTNAIQAETFQCLFLAKQTHYTIHKEKTNN
jgi:hypothetical protein